MIGLLIVYLLYKKICKKKVSKKEKYTDPIQTIINEMKNKNSMDTLGEYFYETLSVGYRNNPRVKKAYEDQEAQILYGETLDIIKDFEELSKLNIWWNTQPENVRKIPYVIRFKKLYADGLRFAFIISEKTDKDALKLLYNNSPLKDNPAVIKAYKKRRKEILTPLVDSAKTILQGTNNKAADLDYFNQIDKDVLDFSETSDYKKSNYVKSLREVYTYKIGLRLATFTQQGKSSADSLNASDKQMGYYEWLSELENYWLRLPEWVREYNKDKNNSMLKVFQASRKVTILKVNQLYTNQLKIYGKLSSLVNFHNKVPQRVKMFPIYQAQFKMRFNVLYLKAKTEVLKEIKGSKNRNVLIDFRKRSEADPNFKGFFGLGTNPSSDAPTIITEFWKKYNESTDYEKNKVKETITNISNKTNPDKSIFFELLLEWETLGKVPTKKISENGKEKIINDPKYSHYNWITRLHTNNTYKTTFSTTSDSRVEQDQKDTTIYNTYEQELNKHSDNEYNKIVNILENVVGKGSNSGLNNITNVFNDNYFRKHIFNNQSSFSSMYTKLVDYWNTIFTDYAVECFPKTDQTVDFLTYKGRWENIRSNKFYEIVTYDNVTKIEAAYTSNPEIKNQVITEIQPMISLVELEAFMNTLPSTFQTDPDIQVAYETRVLVSLKDDMESYSTIVYLLEYWIGLAKMFTVLPKVKQLFHDTALRLMRKDIIGTKMNQDLGIKFDNIVSGTGTWNVSNVVNYWLRIRDYKIIKDKNIEYEQIIIDRIKLLFPQECNDKTKVSTLTDYWNKSHNLIKNKYKYFTWSPFVKRLEILYKNDIEKFKEGPQYENLVKYWRALDPIVRGQSFAWPTFLPKFEKLVKIQIEKLVTTKQLEEKIWKHKDLLKYSAVIIESYGKKINNLRIAEGMAKNVATLTKRGECPADFPYAYIKNDKYLPDSCCKYDPYINNPVGKVECNARQDCPHDAGCYMHTDLHCTKNADCMAFGEELKPGVKCDLLNGSCLYCPDGRHSPVGSPKCQWGAQKSDFKHPVEPTYGEIMP